MNINAPVAVSDLKYNRKCQILLFKPAINYPAVVAKLNLSPKSSRLPPLCSRDRDGMSRTTRTNSKSPRINRRTKGNPLTPVPANPKQTPRPVRPTLIAGPVQRPQHPHLLPPLLGLPDQGRLRDQGHRQVPVPPLDPWLLHLAVSPDSSRRCTGRGHLHNNLQKIAEILSLKQPGLNSTPDSSDPFPSVIVFSPSQPAHIRPSPQEERISFASAA